MESIKTTMPLSVKIISLGVPWVMNRLKKVEAFWGDAIEFNWQEVDADLTALEMTEWLDFQAVLAPAVVNRWSDASYQLTVICAPFVLGPKDYSGAPLIWSDSTGPKPRVSVNGLQLGHTLEIFCNEHDSLMSNQVDLGPAFEVWLNHEISHYLYGKFGLVDNTHLHFYAGHPERVLEELNPHLHA